MLQDRRLFRGLEPDVADNCRGFPVRGRQDLGAASIRLFADVADLFFRILHDPVEYGFKTVHKGSPFLSGLAFIKPP